MEKFLLFIVHGCVLELVMARLDLTITSNACEKNYDMADIGEAYVTYDGAWIDRERCTVQFINYQEHSKQTCVTPINFKLGRCSTAVEYHRHFISEYRDQKTLFTCNNASSQEWCGQMWTTRLYIVFKTSRESYNDYVQLYVYLKYYPQDGDDDDDDGWVPDSNRTRYGIVIPVACAVVVLIVIIIVFCVIRFKKSQIRRMPRTPNTHQTTRGQLNAQTESVSPAQPMIGYQPPQQSQFESTIQGSYQLQPVQSAYPAPAQQGYSPVKDYQPVSQTEYGHQSPDDFQGRCPDQSAPPNPNTDPPPPYASVAK